MALILRLPTELEAKLEIAVALEKAKQGQNISKHYFIEKLISEGLKTNEMEYQKDIEKIKKS